MSDGFVVRKGAAVPAATHPGDAARFHARRTIVLPAINLHMAAMQTDTTIARSRAHSPRAARLTGAAAPGRRKFTFRIEPGRHAAFCRAAESQNISRQRLLTEALDALLHRLGHASDAAAAPASGTANSTFRPGGSAMPLPHSASALRLPL